MMVEPSERTCRRAITFLLGHVDPSLWSLKKLEEFGRCLEQLPADYDVKARREMAELVDQLFRRRTVEAFSGIKGQQAFPGPDFDETRRHIETLSSGQAVPS